MMIEQFTVEEINLMCIFNTTGRVALVDDLLGALDSFDEPELIEIAERVLVKLSKMTDADFAALEFYPEYGDEEVDANGE